MQSTPIQPSGSPDTGLNPAFEQAFERAVLNPAIAFYSALRKASDEILDVHENHVGRIVGVLAKSMGLPDDEVAEMERASFLHDIGKFAIPKAILGKEGPLTPDEILEMQKHSEKGAEILISAGLDPNDTAVQVARFHHERFDGSGYPEGLAGSDIPLAARITAAADVYDALRAKRPYKEPVDHQTALKMILEGNGRTRPEHFDPDVLQALSDCQESVRNVWESRSDSPVN